MTSSWLGIPQQTTRRAIDINIVDVIMDASRLNFSYLFRNVQLVPKIIISNLRVINRLILIYLHQRAKEI